MGHGNETIAHCQSLTHFLEDKIKVDRNDLFTEIQLANGGPGRGLTLECADSISSCEEKKKCVYHSNPNSNAPLISSRLLNWKIEFPYLQLANRPRFPPWLPTASRWCNQVRKMLHICNHFGLRDIHLFLYLFFFLEVAFAFSVFSCQQS